MKSTDRIFMQASNLLYKAGWALSWEPDEEGYVKTMLTKRRDSIYTKAREEDWDVWDAELGEMDLAFVVKTLLEIK